MDPNSTHQRWSRWTATVIPDPALWPMPFDTVKENAARFYRKAFGSSSALSVTRTESGSWVIDCRTEGHPAHDPSYVVYLTDQLRAFLVSGFGPKTEVHFEVVLEAGSREDGSPRDQLVIGAPPILLDNHLLGE